MESLKIEQGRCHVLLGQLRRQFDEGSLKESNPTHVKDSLGNTMSVMCSLFACIGETYHHFGGRLVLRVVNL